MNLTSFSLQGSWRATLAIIACACLCPGIRVGAQVLPGVDPADPDYAPGELIIKFRAAATDAEFLDAWRGGGLGLVRWMGVKDPEHPGIVHATTRLGVAQALRVLEKHPAIEYVEPNYKLRPTVFPNDPRFADCWGLHNLGEGTAVEDADIDAPEAWNFYTGSSAVLIGVVDTGIDISHEDLDANIWTNPGEVPNDGIDNDGNGYIDDVHGWDFWNGDNTVYDPLDGDGHGTHVAGTIAAEGNNGIGVAGVNWRATIVPLKFIGPEFGYFSGAIAAVNYAASKGVKVLNGSFGRYSSGPGDVGQGLKDAIESSGILFVAAAGNDNNNNDKVPFYPASYDSANVIAVAATDRRDRKASFSSYGAISVDLGAPGAGILSTTPGNQYQLLAGTSMAAPHVAGVAGLLYGRYPQLATAQVKQQILSTVDPISALAGITVTGGRLNAARALVLPDQAPTVALTAPANETVVFGTVTVSATAFDDQAVTQVSFHLDGGTLLGTDIEAPYEIAWDSTAGTDGVHSISATARDTAGQTTSHSVTVLVDNYNDAPVANAGPDQKITDGDGDGVETVTLDGSASFDSDGAITAYQWLFNGAEIGAAPGLTHSFAIGSHSVTLIVTDDEGASASDSVVVEVAELPAEMHSGDLTGRGENQGGQWKATVVVTIHDSAHQPVAGATVMGTWSGGFTGQVSATTGSNGQCSFVTGLMPKRSGSVTFTVTGAQHATLAYNAAANHNGTSITVLKP